MAVTPATGAISISDVNNAINNVTPTAADAARSFSWIRDNTKDSATDIGGVRNREYYQRNVDGNCSNGNCTSNCNCGNIQCTNCVISGQVNCANCDAKAWLQANCNCNCTYNCTTSQTSYNCACRCQCDCLFSDDRLKTKSGKINNPLDVLRELEGFYYRGNETAAKLGLSTAPEVGVSAQKVAEYLPEALGKKIAGEYLTVKYERLVPLLIEAIKELESKVTKSDWRNLNEI